MSKYFKFTIPLAIIVANTMLTRQCIQAAEETVYVDSTQAILVAEGSRTRVLVPAVRDHWLWEPKLNSERKLIAFVDEADHVGFGSLEVINFDGTGRRRVTDDAVVLWAFIWSKNGKQLIYAPDLNGTIRIIDVETKKQLIDATAKDQNRRFKLLKLSPDGSCIACVTTAGTLYSFDLDKKQFTLLGEQASTHSEYLAWSPDSQHIAYIRENGIQPKEDSANDVCIVTPQGAHRVVARVKEFSKLSWNDTTTGIHVGERLIKLEY